MKSFSSLLDRLVYTPQRNAKLALIADYFARTPDPDRGWALAALTDGLPASVPIRRLVSELLAPRIDAELYRLSRDYVGDTAETVALLWPEPSEDKRSPELGAVVAALIAAERNDLPGLLEGWLDSLDGTGRWGLLKLLGGGLRVGVSARLGKTALARFGGRDVAEIEELWHGLQPPYLSLFAWLEGRGEKPDISGQPVFRPLMLAHPLEEADRLTLDLDEFSVEWKWDGIRVQLVANPSEVRLYSRTGDDIGPAFPDLTAAFSGDYSGDVVLDGELLVMREGEVAPFNDLQQRLGRKAVTRRIMSDYPAHIRLYDMLLSDGEDLRALPLIDRRQQLEHWHQRFSPQRTDLSQVLNIGNAEELFEIWSSTRGSGIEGLMLKRRNSPYLAGRPKGHWFKWKRAALTADVVLMYAQLGSGKRSSYYSDYTFGAWRVIEGSDAAGEGSTAGATSDADGATGGLELVPVGKAYSGFTDEELLALDRWIRSNTVERYGPVRAVAPGLVLEVAFDAVQKSARHKSGIALRFPRIHRIRWDKPAEEADRLEYLYSLIEQ